MPPYPSANFEIQRYYQNEPRFNGVYSRNNFPEKIKDGAYVTNLDEHADTSTHWIALFLAELKLFISIVLVLNMEHEEIKEFIVNKNLIANIF